MSNSNQSFFNSFSVRTKIQMMVCALLLSVGGSSAFLIYRSLGRMEAQALQTLQSISGSVEDSIKAQFYERYGDVQAFALNSVMQNGNKEAITSTLNDYAGLYGIYDLIVFVDTKGNLIAANNKSAKGESLDLSSIVNRNFANENWFKATMAGQFTEDKSKAFLGTYFEEAQVDPVSTAVYKKEMWGTVFSALVKKPSGEILGVVTTRANFDWVEDCAKTIYESQKASGYTSTKLTLLSKEGIELMNFDPSANHGEMKRDFDQLGKLNFFKAGHAAALKIQAGSDDGTLYSKDVDSDMQEAVGYSKLNGHKWIDSIGWSILVHVDKSEFLQDISSTKSQFIWSFIALFSLGFAFAYMFTSRLSNTLGGLASNLAREASQVSDASKSIAESSAELSEASTEQASALQETVSSVDEINAMVGKNAETAAKSKEISDDSQEAATRGKKAVDDMILSIDDISRSNSQIMEQITHSNTEIEGIIKVIAEIGNKTKIINDIVFQTKLLSFNASVEAARAGEHGKGFAVVAEEVGNLAQMSGNAAKEITDMLDNSIAKVTSIVSNTKLKVEGLMSDGRQKVETGTMTARKCGEVLDDILKNVTTVNEMVAEIAAASQEQAQGVSEVTKAMSQLDQVTQQNNAVALASATSSEQLGQQASALNQLVTQLTSVVWGQGSANQSASTKSSSSPAHSAGKVVNLADKRASHKSSLRETKFPVKK